MNRWERSSEQLPRALADSAKRPDPAGSKAQPALANSSDWSIGKLLNRTGQFLAEKGSDSPRLDAEVLLAHALGCRRIDLYTRFDEAPSPTSRETFRKLVRGRVEGCPVAYLVGKKEFFALELEVNPSVLIPRPESEFVVMECGRLAKDMTAPRVIDIGTGSGNIAIAVAKLTASTLVTAVDISPDALAVARRNARRHEVIERIRFLEGDLFGPLLPDERFDFILSNPPYIASADIPQLPRGVRDFEPHLALDGGDQGYAVFDRLIRESTKRLVRGGYLIVEIGAPQEQPARGRIRALGSYELGETVHDYSGHARVLWARLI